MQITQIPIQVKKTCCEMYDRGVNPKEIYDTYFKQQIDMPQSLRSFRRSLNRWRAKQFPDDTTLVCGTYEGFTAHGATVQVDKNGEIIQAWIKQTAGEFDPDEFIEAIKSTVKPYKYVKPSLSNPSRMLEIPLFDMHWGIAFMDYYEPVLKELLNLICSRSWDRIVIPFGQDFFHNDSIANGQTTKGTVIEKVDMTRAVKDGQQFTYALVDAALKCANKVEIIYSPGNHDRSISWMFMQVLLERYGAEVADDSLEYRKVISYGKNAIMVTHGDSKQATPKNLAHIFPISFPSEFANATTREVHAGHLHCESETDVYGVMVRRLSTGGIVDEWSDRQDFVGAHCRFMVFEWALDGLRSIYYI